MKKFLGLGKKGKYSPNRKESLKIDGPFYLNTDANILPSAGQGGQWSAIGGQSEPLIRESPQGGSFDGVIDQLNAIKRVEKETPDSNIQPSKVRTSFERQSSSDHRDATFGRGNYQDDDEREVTFRQTTIHTSKMMKSSLKMERNVELINPDDNESKRRVRWSEENDVKDGSKDNDSSDDDEDDPFNQIRNQRPKDKFVGSNNEQKMDTDTSFDDIFGASGGDVKRGAAEEVQKVGAKGDKRENEAFIEEMRKVLEEEKDVVDGIDDEIEELLMSDSFNQPPPSFAPPILNPLPGSADNKVNNGRQNKSNDKEKKKFNRDFDFEDSSSSASDEIKMETINDILKPMPAADPVHQPLRRVAGKEMKYQLSLNTSILSSDDDDEEDAVRTPIRKQSMVPETDATGNKDKNVGEKKMEQTKKKELPPVKPMLLKEPPLMKQLPPVRPLMLKSQPAISISFDSDDEDEGKVEVMKDLKISTIKEIVSDIKPVAEPKINVESKESTSQPMHTNQLTPNELIADKSQPIKFLPQPSSTSFVQPVPAPSQPLTAESNHINQSNLNQSVHDLVTMLEKERSDKRMMQEKMDQQQEAFDNLQAMNGINSASADKSESDQISKLFKEKLELEERIFSLQSKISKISYDKELIESDVSDLKRENSNLILIKDRLKSENDQLRDDKDRLFKDKISLQHELDHLSAHLKSVSNQPKIDKETEDRYHEVVRKNADMSNEIYSLKQMLMRKENEYSLNISEINSKLDLMKKENDRLQKEINNRDAEMSILEKKLSQIRKSEEEAEKQKMSEVTLSIKELNSMMTRLDAKITSLNDFKSEAPIKNVTREMVISPELDAMLASLQSTVERLDDMEETRRRLKDKEEFEMSIDPEIFNQVYNRDANFDARVETPKKLFYSDFLSRLDAVQRPRSLFVKTLFKLESSAQKIVDADDNYNITGDAYLYQNQLTSTPIKTPRTMNGNLDNFYIAKKHLDKEILSLKYDLGLYSETLRSE